ncbi:four helix bundle protein [Patescibacteria group bacterium]|nr:four helix bundle protein [Patescibacteria group bacterium]
MNKSNHTHTHTLLLPLLQKLKDVYILWHGYHNTLPKTHRYSLGKKVDDLFTATIGVIAGASFLPRNEKTPYVKLAIRKLDTLKIFLLILWETKSLDNKKYVALSNPLDEVGKMLGGWLGQLNKQNSLDLTPREK